MRKKSSLQSQKSTKTFGRKKPDKLAFQKYAKFQSDLAEKQKNLEVEDIEEIEDDEVFVFPDQVQKELDDMDARRPRTRRAEKSVEEFICEFCGQALNSEKGRKIHITKKHKKTNKGC